MDYPNVLLVDDDTMVTRALTRVLSQHCKLNVTTASSTLQALDYLEKSPFAVVVADLSLPGIHALSLFKIAKERWPTMKRAIFSGRLVTSMSQEDLELVDLFVEKGAQPVTVAEKICDLAKAPHT